MNSHDRTSRPCIAMLALVLAAGCAHEESTHGKSATGAEAGHTTTTAATVKKPTNTSGLSVSARLMEACQITVNDIAEAPKFDFDKADLRDDDTSVLAQIATCVTTGPLKGHTLHLVGRADPRGEVEYNMVLGESRADTVDRYLKQLGVAESMMFTSSRGQLDATGTDELSWQRDRRVDIDVK